MNIFAIVHKAAVRVSFFRIVLFAVIYCVVLYVPFQVAASTGSWEAAVLAMGVLATVAPVFFNQLRRKAERALLEEQLWYQQTLKEFASNLIFIRNEKELAQKVASEIMRAMGLTFCAMYLKDKESGKFNLAGKESREPIELPLSVESDLEFLASLILKKSEAHLNENDLPQFKGLKLEMAFPLFVKNNFLGFLLLGPREGARFSSGDKDVLATITSQTALSLSEIYYFQAWQKALEEKYAIALEKERLESAFQISEAYRHELGNVINIISLSLVNLTEDEYYKPTPDDIRRSAESIASSVKRAQNIFNSISRYNDQAQSRPVTIDIGAAVKAQLDGQRALIVAKNIKLSEEISGGLVSTVNENFHDAIRYLLEGALKAVDYFSPSQRLIAVTLAAHHGKAVLKISDTGNDVTKNMIYTGVGLERGKDGGLSYFIARRIMRDQNADFKITAYGENGTSFIVEIPLDAASKEETTHEQ